MIQYGKRLVGQNFLRGTIIQNVFWKSLENDEIISRLNRKYILTLPCVIYEQQ